MKGVGLTIMNVMKCRCKLNVSEESLAGCLLSVGT